MEGPREEIIMCFCLLLKHFCSVWQTMWANKSVLYEVVISCALGKRNYQTYVFLVVKTNAVLCFHVL